MASLPGTIISTVEKAILSSAHIARVAPLGEGFRQIELEGDQLRDAKWRPGDKIQVRVGTFSFRTYTPVAWDAANGRLSLLVHLGAEGPGTRWAAAAKPGDQCAFHGPSRALRLPAGDEPVVLFGDETSIGTAAAIRAERPHAGDRFVFEVSDETQVAAALGHFGLADAVVIAKGPGHARAAARAVTNARAENGADRVLLTGRVKSMRKLGTSLVTNRSASLFQLRSKPYWMDGIPGLD